MVSPVESEQQRRREASARVRVPADAHEQDAFDAIDIALANRSHERAVRLGQMVACTTLKSRQAWFRSLCEQLLQYMPTVGRERTLSGLKWSMPADIWIVPKALSVLFGAQYKHLRALAEGERDWIYYMGEFANNILVELNRNEGWFGADILYDEVGGDACGRFLAYIQ